ncbi:hypothetical protein CCS01_08075 [Rhodopila globiformis]|uniref:Uncharacterized protein n=1 Tax=Rhodopila globiformis TaxID=1071 RepID=A0A2S6NK20_RHOGL|nr:hypothetical protein CCS01_08075 [Rhodopila globiformis]
MMPLQGVLAERTVPFRVAVMDSKPPFPAAEADRPAGAGPARRRIGTNRLIAGCAATRWHCLPRSRLAPGESERVVWQ